MLLHTKEKRRGYKYVSIKAYMNKETLTITTLVGTIMGAGLLGLPYVASQAGIVITLGWLLVIGLAMTYIMLSLGEVILRTKQKHQLTGYAKKYVGSIGKNLMTLSMIFGIYAALLAYIIGESQSLSYIITGSFQQSITLGVLFWVALSLATYGGINVAKKGEFVGVVLVLILIAVIAVLAFPEIKTSNITYIDPSNWAAPVGLIIFSLLGYSALPEARQNLGEKAPSLKKSIIIAYSITIVVYALLIILITGALGTRTPEIATLALGRGFAIIGVLTMLTAYMALATALIDMFRYDYGWEKKNAWIATSTVPLVLFALVSLTQIATFTTILEIGGLIAGGIAMVLILLMVKKAKVRGDRKPEYSLPTIKGLIPLMIILLLAITLIEVISLLA